MARQRRFVTPPGGMGLSRRGFVLSALGLGGLAALGGVRPLAELARATSARDTHVIFCYFRGGWDILLSLDPRDPARFNEANMAQTFIQPGYQLLVGAPGGGAPIDVGGGRFMGPYIGDLAAHMDKVSVIRGMSMETLTHEVGRRRFLTGKPPSGLLARGSSTATWLAAHLGESQLIPQIAVNVESYNMDQPTWASALKVAGVEDLTRALTPGGGALDPRVEAQVDALLAQHAACGSVLGSDCVQTAEDSRLGAQLMVESGLDASFDFLANTPEMEALRSHYGFTRSASQLDTPGGQAALAVTALTAGISRVVSVRLASSLDTHYDEWTTDHGPEQQAGFNAVARMIEDLQRRPYGSSGDSWLDHTIIVGFSEFSRTAMLNANLGRDHALTNACFVAGGGLAGGRIVGRSSDVGLSPTTTDLNTGLSSPDGEVVRPEHVLKTVMSAAGIEGDPADLRVQPLSCLLS